MEKNELIRTDQGLYRILSEDGDSLFVADCLKKRMPFRMAKKDLNSAEYVSEGTLPRIRSVEDLTPKEYETVQRRYTFIADILCVIDDPVERSRMIRLNADIFGMNPI